MMFRSPTRGLLTLEQVADDIRNERRSDAMATYRVIIGTDSQPKSHQQAALFVTAIILHKLGRGARYYVHKEEHLHMASLRQRMFTEASLSLQTGELLSDFLKNEPGDWHVELHLDVGPNGPTREWAGELVSWVETSGYQARIKPDSFGASKVADRYTKS